MLRESYGCDCSGPVPLGRVRPDQTDGQLRAIETWTGMRSRACPWRTFRDPFVQRVIDAYDASKRGIFAQAYPDPSHRLIRGLQHFASVFDQVDQQRRLEEQRNADAARERR